jgi:hypothetical protein
VESRLDIANRGIFAPNSTRSAALFAALSYRLIQVLPMPGFSVMNFPKRIILPRDLLASLVCLLNLLDMRAFYFWFYQARIVAISIGCQIRPLRHEALHFNLYLPL